MMFSAKQAPFTPAAAGGAPSLQPVLSQQPTSAAASAQQQPGTMMFSAKQAPFTLAAAVTMALQPIFLTLSKGPKGYFEYSVGSATLLCELLKLGFSSISLAIQLARNPELKSSVLSNRPWLEFAQFFVPSVIYFANNNLVFVILMALDPSTFQLVSQTKTIFTGILFRFMLRRRLTIFQWMALFFLACGTACSQIPSAEAREAQAAQMLMTRENKLEAGSNELSLPAWVGVLVTLLTAVLSSLAGVYNELLLKGRVVAPIHWQNMQMYLHGAWLNFAFMMIYDGEDIRANGMLHGYTWLTWAAILCNASVGIAVSAVLKYCDNIARVYAHSIAMLCVMLVSVPLFGLAVTAQLIIALLLVTGSTLQYNVPKDYAERFDPIEEPVPGEAGKLKS
jgi:UDP-sugar transporter A1/2/3